MTARRPGTIKHAGAYRKKVKPQQVRCCPTCLNLLVWTPPETWTCPKHGVPTRP